MESDQTHQILTTCVLAVSAGVLLLVVSRRFNIPGIVLLLLGGMLLGPEGFGLVDPAGLGDGLRVIVMLGIGIVLFEGGLTLDLHEYGTASQIIKRLLSVGVLATWFLTAAAVYLIFDTAISVALISGSLVIVTGPTVIAPLLRRVKVTNRIRTILHWEGVLIDPIGVFIALLCFEWIATQSGQIAIENFFLRIVFGMLFGVVGGLCIYWAERKRLVPEDMVNVFSLAAAVLIFGLTESILSEAGLLAVTVAGLVLGWKKPVRLEEIREFKAEITDLVIGTIFILLAARLNLDQFATFGYQGALVVAIVMFVVRPVNIWISSWGLDLSFRERLFLSWVAPRGIVAGSMASLFVLSGKLDAVGPDPLFIETFVYSVIVATIIIQGFSAGYMARLLGLYKPQRSGWVIVGAHSFGREIARFIKAKTDRTVVLIDTNASAIDRALASGLDAMVADARNPEIRDSDDFICFQDVGNILSLTDNEDLNTLVCQEWLKEFGAKNVFRWGRMSSRTREEGANAAGTLIWSDLPKPSLIADALNQGSVTLQHDDNYDDQGPTVRTPIISIEDGSNAMIMDPPSSPGIDTSKLLHTLYLRQELDVED